MTEKSEQTVAQSSLTVAVDLRELVASRGQTKGAISRLLNFIHEKSLSVACNELILAKKARLIDAFEKYENLNVKISLLDPADSENIEKVEDTYFAILTKIEQQLNKGKQVYAENESLSTPVASVSSKINLPNIVLNTFSGKCSEYIPFINLYKSLIDQNQSLDNIQKLYYLRSYLKAEPLDLIKNLPLTVESYVKALDILDNRYNNKYRLLNEHINLLIDLKPIVKSTAVNLREFVCNIKQIIAALSNLEPNVKYWDAIILCILCRKLDMYTSRAYQLERNTEEEPTIDAFLAYVEKRALALENADPGSNFTGQHRQQTKEQGLVAYTATKQPTCLLCAASIGVTGLYVCGAA